MASKMGEELPFSARYSLPAQLAASLGDVSWESVAQLSTEFQVRTEQKGSRVKKVIKELQMSRLLLMDRIKHQSAKGGVDPKLLVDVVKLLQRCEELASEYELDLREFSTFLYLISEKLKKEKIVKHETGGDLPHMRPIREGLASIKGRLAKSGWRKKTRHGRK